MSQRNTSVSINETAQGTFPTSAVVESDQSRMVYQLFIINQMLRTV